MPLLRANCIGCHCPAKKEGKLLLTTYKAFNRGGKKGAGFVPGKPDDSIAIKMISGEKPEMPKNADPLKPEEIDLLSRWIREGAVDDTPPPIPLPTADHPPVYHAPPVISALAWSPDGALLSVSGYHEVLLHSVGGAPPAGAAPAVPACACKAGCGCAHCKSGGDNPCGCGGPATPAAPVASPAKTESTNLASAPSKGGNLVGRLVGESPRIESFSFSPDGKQLAVSGGMPAEFGQVQVWNVASRTLVKSYKMSADVLYGVSWSPDGLFLGLGGADKGVRVIAVDDGREAMKFDNHTEWVLGTTFTLNGKRLLSGCRDRAMKLISVENGQFIDDINKLLEPVLCMARHPREDVIAYGGGLGTPRIYKISDNQDRTRANNDTNLLKEFERQPGAVRAIAWSPDAEMIAVGGVGPEVRLYAAKTGARAAALTGHEGAVFALAFHPGGRRLAVGGFDGTVRIYDVAHQSIVTSFVPVPIAPKP